MKRVRIAKGKHVVISDELAAKAARVFASGLTREQFLDLAATEPRHATGLMAGSKKPLALSRSRSVAHGETSTSTSAKEDSATHVIVDGPQGVGNYAHGVWAVTPLDLVLVRLHGNNEDT